MGGFERMIQKIGITVLVKCPFLQGSFELNELTMMCVSVCINLLVLLPPVRKIVGREWFQSFPSVCPLLDHYLDMFAQFVHLYLAVQGPPQDMFTQFVHLDVTIQDPLFHPRWKAGGWPSCLFQFLSRKTQNISVKNK